MILVTTADERTWKHGEKILFLGEWCKLFARKDKWSKLDYKVLSYHWDDHEKLYKDYLYLNNLYEEILLELSKNLNKIHGVNYSVRYWRIIVGLWLLGFILALYDRYQSILVAAEHGKVKNTLIIRSDETSYVPQDFGVFSRWVTESDEYNHYLYRRIIEYIDRIPFEYIDSETQGILYFDNLGNVTKKAFRFKKIVKKLFQQLDRFNKIVFVETCLSANDNIRLQFSLHQFPSFVYHETKKPKSIINLDLRNKIHLRSSDDKFQELLMRLITEQIPTLYLEDYAHMNRISLKTYPRRPKVIFNGVAFNANEPFKFWAAYNVERNIKLLGVQHGGLYGSGLLTAPEDHQIKICDTFYTWGWGSDCHKNTKPLMAASLNTIKGEICPKKGGRLLLVEMAIPRYSFIPEMLCTSSTGFLAYLDEQYRFVRTLSPRCKELLLVRLFMHDYQLSQKDQWVSKFPEIECSDAEESMINQINMSSLFIGTYNATTYLGPFVANFPTVLFWNPEHWKVRASAQSYFDGLRKVGILHDTPEGAADKVNEIFGDPISWWNQPCIQEAKDMYCSQFVRISDKWLGEWKCELQYQMRN